MMKVLYIGHFNEGSTSKMRGEYLKKILNAPDMIVANIDIPILNIPRIYKSLGWRYKIGPFIEAINKYILSIVSLHDYFDVAWIDKGVFIRPEVIQKIRSLSSKMIHFTPDPSFLYHRSNFFFKTIPEYDFCVTTKSFEVEQYIKYNAKSVFFCTQGFDPSVHKRYHNFNSKKGVVFIGHREENREEAISLLIENGIPFKLAGIKWDRLVSRYKYYKNFTYYGNGIFGESYANLLSESLIGLGFLSKIIPEKHTTRTFEIPACGTILATERTDEIKAVFSDDEVIYFQNAVDLLEKVKYVINNTHLLKSIGEKGYKKVTSGGYDYFSILEKVTSNMNLK